MLSAQHKEIAEDPKKPKPASPYPQDFARWYALTGGVDGPVLFISFEQRKPLADTSHTVSPLEYANRTGRHARAGRQVRQPVLK